MLISHLLRNPFYLLLLALPGLAVMTLCRFLFFYVNNTELVSSPPAQSLLTGLRFDLLVISFWLILPFSLGLLVQFRSKALPLPLHQFLVWYLRISMVLLVLISVADVAWYSYFYAHISTAILNWMKDPGDMLKMLFSERLYLLSILAFFILCIIALLLTNAIHRNFQQSSLKPGFRIPAWLMLSALLFLGMRGGLRARPLSLKDANFSEHHFFNNLALNPIYNLYQELFGNQQNFYLPHQHTVADADSLVAQFASAAPEGLFPRIHTKPNVVLILMESMASWKMQDAHFLDSLSKNSIYFDSFFSSGEHTYNGIFSTLYGEPAVMGKHMLRLMEHSTVSGLPGVLKQAGYFSLFHIPHNRTFDNMSSFLWQHHFDSIVDYSQLPKDLQGGSGWGTCDHNWYEYAVRNMNALENKGKPFFNVILTISDHPPYFVPSGEGIPGFGAGPAKMVRYTDWSISRFFKLASQCSWFSNTVFVILGDHGHFSGKADFPLPLSFHRIPCLIYSPKLIPRPFTTHQIAMQQDLFPTLSSILGLKANSNPVSYDLSNSNRPFAVFCSDQYSGILSSDFFAMMDESGNAYGFSRNGNPASTEETSVWTDRMKIITSYTGHRIQSEKK